jgi:hypothetical protein
MEKKMLAGLISSLGLATNAQVKIITTDWLEEGGCGCLIVIDVDPGIKWLKGSL